MQGACFSCESWTIKNAEHWRTDAFKLWCWRRLHQRVLWTARRFNQSILKISTEYSLEGLMLKLFGHLMLRKTEGRRRRGRQRMKWLDGITDSLDMSLRQAPGVGDGQGSLMCCSPWRRKESRHNWVTELMFYLTTCLNLILNEDFWLQFSFPMCETNHFDITESEMEIPIPTSILNWTT